MNKDMDFNSKKFMLLLMVICLVFFIVIIKAFEYLPNNDDNLKPVSVNDLNKPRDIKIDAEEQKVEEETTEDESEKKTLNIKLPQPTDKIDLEEIDAPVGTGLEPIADSETAQETKEAVLTPDQIAYNTLYNALQYKNKGQYEKAIAEYKKIPNIVNNKETIAASYEGIATVYAASKRYGTALSYATKAYNMSPSSSREILLARLYYKTGDIDKATKRINNVLHRDFSDDK